MVTSKYLILPTAQSKYALVSYSKNTTDRLLQLFTADPESFKISCKDSTYFITAISANVAGTEAILHLTG
jgi:hypothetical protein